MSKKWGRSCHIADALCQDMKPSSLILCLLFIVVNERAIYRDYTLILSQIKNAIDEKKPAMPLHTQVFFMLASVLASMTLNYARFAAAKSQLTNAQNASRYFGRALR